MTQNINTNTLITIAKEAGRGIMKHYKGHIEVEIKDDNSPVTIADKEANELIVTALKKLTPNIPIVAEENTEEENSHAISQPTFWLVDPLDGTKSFIKKSDEFTVNIALIENLAPSYGVVYVPAQDVTYFTDNEKNAYKQDSSQTPEPIAVRKTPAEGLTVIASKSHLTPETDDFINKLPKVHSIIPAASSLKFCLIAEGKADIYPRFGPTMEWDTAAGHAVLLAAGGVVTNTDDTPLAYGKKDFRNPYFIAKPKN